MNLNTNRISLDGTWRFRLDPKEEAEDLGWQKPVVDFPHEGWCDYQWFDLIAGERVPHVCAPFHHTPPGVCDLSKWPVEIEPIVRSIPLWKNCENRAYLFEVGTSSLIIRRSGCREQPPAPRPR